MTARPATLTLLDQGAKRQRERYAVMDLSYGGMRFRSRDPFGDAEEHRFLIEIEAPVRDSAVVRAQIRWGRALGPRSHDCGAVFLESTKGWLGPEEQGSE